MELTPKVDEYQPHFSFSSRGSSYSGFRNHRLDKSNMTTQWKQLYLSRAKLKAVSRTSALIAGFAMVAMVEVQLDREAIYDPILLIMFSTVTTCLVAVHLFALMIATCMLPNIEAVSNIHNAKAISQSPHHKMRTYIEIAWVLSTGVGLVLFMIEIGLLIWLKFVTLGSSKNTNTNDMKDSQKYLPAWIATAVLIPAGILFAGFAVRFYRKLAQHRYNRFEEGIMELDRIIKDDEAEQGSPHLHPNSLFVDNNHQSVSRVHSGVSVQSQAFSNQSGPSIIINNPSRASSLSGQFSMDPI